MVLQWLFFHWDSGSVCCGVSESVCFTIIICFTGTVVLFQSLYSFPSLSVSLRLLCCFRACTVSIIVCFTGTVVLFPSLYSFPSLSVSLGLLCCFRVCTVFHHCLFHRDCCAVSESVCFTIIVCFTGTYVLFQSLYSFPSLSVSLVVLHCFRVCTVFHHCLFHW